MSVNAIYALDWDAIGSLGFKGCVLDKDNTLTRPYSMALEPGVQASLAHCRAALDGNLVIFSNSAGLSRCLTALIDAGCCVLNVHSCFAS
jgi:phosphatidylglycerophosphatase GEP4